MEVRLGRREGLPQASVANFDDLHVVPRTELASRIGSLPPTRTAEAKRALGWALDWRELKEIERP